MSRPVCEFYLKGTCRYCRQEKREDGKDICANCSRFCYGCKKETPFGFPEIYCSECREKDPKCLLCKAATRLPNEYFCSPCQKFSSVLWEEQV